MPDFRDLDRTPADRWPDDSTERGEANRILREERFRFLAQGVTDYAVTADVRVAMVVRQDEEDVRPTRGRGG